MKNKKLLFIINADWYFKLHWLARAKAAKSEGYEVHIAAAYSDENLRLEFEAIGFTTHAFKLHRSSINPLKELQSYQQIKNIIREIKPDIIHTATVKPNIYAGLAIKEYKIKLIINITGLGYSFSNRSIKAKATKALITALYRKIAIKNETRFIFENSENQSLFKSLNIGKVENLILIPGAGVDCELFSPKKEIKKEEPSILFAARLLKDKGLQELIEASIALKKQGVKHTINVAGIIDYDSPGAIKEKQLFKWEKEGLINWLGQREDIHDLIIQSSVVCLPTKYGEGVPRILIEAASSGRPIVATNTTGCKDILHDKRNGFLLNPGDKNSLTTSLKILLESPEKREKFGVYGRDLVERKFDEKFVIARTLEQYI